MKHRFFVQERFSARSSATFNEGFSSAGRRVGTGLLMLLASILLFVLFLSIGSAEAEDGIYDDVEVTKWFASSVETLGLTSITEGTECAGNAFCPFELLTRHALSVWLGRALIGGEPTPSGSVRFADVPSGHPWAAHIDRIVELGFLQECSDDPMMFCPDHPIKRSDIAEIMVEAFGLPEAPEAGIGDIADTANPDAINALVGAGISIGCYQEPLLFCPNDYVTRAQMAGMLARAIHLVPRAGGPSPYLAIDPDLHTGQLENGLTYYVRSNDNPGQSVSIRLVVRAGSVNEPEPHQGIAHFLEHVLFEGTEDYPTGLLLSDTIRDLGAELGPDLNAWVNYNQTVYTLTIAADQPEKVSTALHVLSQMAHAAQIHPRVVVHERGVVIDELRLATRTWTGHISSEFDRIYTEGTPYEGYDPIGTESAIESLTSEELRDFYETWYVPSNMAIVVVGDMPADEMLGMVEQHFGPIPAGERPQFSLPDITPHYRPSYHVVTHEEQGYDYISLDFQLPSRVYGQVDNQRRALTAQLIRLMVANILDDAYYRGELLQVDRPTFQAFSHAQGLNYLGTNWQGDNLSAATTAYMSVLKTIEKHGFSESHLNRAVEALKTSLESRLESAATRNNGPYAQEYGRHFLSGGDLGTAQDRYDQALALLETITPGELTARYRWIMKTSGPVVIAVGSSPDSLPTTDELAEAVAAAKPSAEPPHEEAPIEELMSAPDPVEPTAEGTLDLLEGSYEWEFDNGAKVTFVPSDIAQGTVNMSARSLGGWSQLPVGSAALANTAVEAVLRSGFGDNSKAQINRFLSDNTASLGAFIREREEGFSGSSSPEDLETLFQLVHLLVTAPRVDEAAFGQARNEAVIRTSLSEVNPAWQAYLAYLDARYGLESHRPVVTWEQLASMTAEGLEDLYRSRLGDVDDMALVVVGDVDLAEVERLARHYIGTLPSGESDTFTDLHRPFPTGVTRREVPVAEDASAVLEISHEAAVPTTPANRVNADVLEVILNDQLFNQIREKLGASYVAGINIYSGFAPEQTIFSDVTVTAEVGQLEEVHYRTLALLANIANSGPGAEELRRAVAIVRANYDRITNGTYLGVMGQRLYLEEENLLTPERSLEELERVTPASVRSLAEALYSNGNWIEIIRTPTGSYTTPEG